jgi:(p)ppGpp synthase/HD superfamily hydrolase
MDIPTRIDAFSEASRPTILTTVALMRELHEGQTDPDGHPYFRHPLRVAMNLRRIYPQASDDMMMAALLHDTMEDCEQVDEEFLRQKGYSENCIEIVRLLSRPPDDPRPYQQVVDDLISSGNVDAMIVKIADNMDNLHPERNAEFRLKDPEKSDRLVARYTASIHKLAWHAKMDVDHIFETIKSSPALAEMNAAFQ